MNITQEIMNDNHLKLVVNVQPEDYTAKLTDEIKSLSKKISMKGFRPGKVPVGMTRKMYGNSVLAEHLDKLLNESVLAYIKEHDLKVLGQPIPFEVRHQQFDVNSLQAYDFGFELGLIPPFELPALDTKTLEKKVLLISDDMLQEEIERIRSIHGERSLPEKVGEDDILYGEWKELGADGELKEGGISSTSSFAMKLVKDDVSRQLFFNLNKKDSTDIAVKPAFGNDMELIIHNILKTDHHVADEMGEKFRFTLLNIHHVEKAGLDQAFFDKAFGEGAVHNEEEMKERIKTDLSREYVKYAETRFDRELQDMLINETEMSLPVEFLRKLIHSNKQEEDAVLDEQQLVQALQQVKWDLIHDKLVRDNNVAITREELTGRARKDIANYYGGEEFFQNNTGELDRLAESLLNDEKYANRLRDQVLNDKVFELLKSKISAIEKPVDQHEFFHH